MRGWRKPQHPRNGLQRCPSLPSRVRCRSRVPLAVGSGGPDPRHAAGGRVCGGVRSLTVPQLSMRSWATPKMSLGSQDMCSGMRLGSPVGFAPSTTMTAK